MSNSIIFVEKTLSIATDPDDVEFLVQLLFDLQKDESGT